MLHHENNGPVDIIYCLVANCGVSINSRTYYKLFVHKKYPGKTGLIASICISILSLTAGVLIATKIWKKRGTVDFISRVSASPELDNLNDEKEERSQRALQKPERMK